MFKKEQESTYPMAPAECGAAAAHEAEEMKKKIRNKRIMHFVLFLVIKTAVFLVISFTFMKVHGPKFRLHAAVVTAGSPANSSFSATVNAELAVKNPNFGPYKYEEATVEFLHGGALAGTATVSSSRANMRSTKGLQVSVGLILERSGSSDGVLKLSSRSKMVGKVELMFGLMKKKSSATMNCSMEIVIATQLIRNISCL